MSWPEENAKRETVQLEAALKEAQKLSAHRLQQLIQAEKLSALGMLSAGVAHEIKSPIAFVSSNLEVLDDYLQLYRVVVTQLPQLFNATNKAQELKAIEALKVLWQQEDFEYINRDAVSLVGDAKIGASKVNDLVSNLNAYIAVSDEEGAKLCDLNEEIKTTLKLIRHELKYRIVLHTDFQPLPNAYLFEAEIHQVLINMLMNAIHSIENKGNIWVSTFLGEAHQVIQIRDDGQGIKAENMTAIFEPFFSTKGKHQGTGLGLSLSRDIIAAHNGEILVESVYGEGSQFTIKLPVANTAQSVKAVEQRISSTSTI